MRCFLLSALLAEIYPLRTHTRASPTGVDISNPAVPTPSVLGWLAMLIWLYIAIHPKNSMGRTEIPF